MKSSIQLLISVVFMSVFTPNLSALEVPNTFPFLLGQLERLGSPAPIRLTEWVTPRRDGVFIPIIFEWAEETCTKEGCSEVFTPYEIVNKEIDTCHRVHYVAVHPETKRIMNVVDHQGNFCPEEKKFLWQVEILDGELRTEYVANPAPVRH